MAVKPVKSQVTKIVAADIKVPEDTKNGSILGTYTGKCCDAAVFNNNGMKLDKDLFQNLFESDEYKRAMKYGHYIGFLGHPEDPECQDYKHCCIVMRDLKLLENGELEGTFDVLNTPVGQIVKTLKDAGIDLGISIRGAGDVDAEGNVDPETFILRGFDLVTFPAYDDAIPTFQELAASSNIEKQVTYKKICSVINKNMDHINVSAASELQKNFNKDSDEYKQLEARKADIGVADEDECPECTEEDKLEVIGKKLECMTDLYMEECECNDKLKEEVKSCKDEISSIKASYERKLKHLERITCSQQKLMQDRVTAATEMYKVAVSANTKLKRRVLQAEKRADAITASNSSIKQELKSLEDSNLIYKQKIECSTADIKDRDATISELRSKLDKTVIASTEANRKASNRDEEVKSLKSKISASTTAIEELNSRVAAMEDMLAQYQQAYADIYATAAGISVKGLSVTASTSVRDLETMIQGATNTSNIAAMPSFDASAEYDDQIDDVDDIEGYGADLVTL